MFSGEMLPPDNEIYSCPPSLTDSADKEQPRAATSEGRNFLDQVLGALAQIDQTIPESDL